MLQRYSRFLLLCAFAASPSFAQSLQPAGTAIPFATGAPDVSANASPQAECAADTQLIQDFVTDFTFIYGQGDTATNDGGPQELGQSIVAPCDGQLVSIGIVIQAQNVMGMNYDLTLGLYEGAGTAGTALGSEQSTFTLPEDGAYILTFDGFDAVALSEGDAFTFFVDSNGPNLFIQGVNPGGYADGSAYVSTTTDASGASPLNAIDLRFTVTFQPLMDTAVELPAGGEVSLSAIRPNPVRGEGQLELSVGTSQEVTVTLYDALGREAVVLYEGRVASGASVPVAMQTAGLPAGVYHVRAVGESFAATQQVTVVR